MPLTGALLIFLAILIVVAVWIYNVLIKSRNQVEAAWSDIDVQLKRRHDLVPQLVTTVKAYANHEKATMTAVTELRRQSAATTRLPDKAQVEIEIEQAVHKLLVVAEDYPDLKADQNFRQLQTELTEVEDHLQYARRFYNGAVRQLNTRIQSFPSVILARPLGFNEAEFFEVDDATERVAPKVDVA